MANYTDSYGFNKGTAAFPANNPISIIEVKLDFAEIIAARAAAGATALVATDTIQVIPLPAGTVILSGGLQVTTVESTNTTATFDLGFTGGTTGLFANDMASNALAYDIENLANPHAVTSADTVDLLLNTAVPTNCVVNAFVVVANVAANYV